MKKLTKRFKRALALIADTHVGSKFALFPEVFHSDTATGTMTVRASKKQKDILAFWKYFMGKVCDEWQVDTIIHDGDAIDGKQVKDLAETLCLPSLTDQADAFCQLIQPYLKGRKYLGFAGTKYHESVDTKIHRVIAQRIGGTYGGIIRNVKLKDTKIVMNITHAINSAMYLSGQLDKTEAFLLMAEAAGKIPRANVILRAHVHSFLHVDTSRKHLCIIPGWKAFEPYAAAVKNYGRMQPAIGGAILLVDEKDRVTIYHYLMDKTPHILDEMTSI